MEKIQQHLHTVAVFVFQHNKPRELIWFKMIIQFQKEKKMIMLICTNVL